MRITENKLRSIIRKHILNETGRRYSPFSRRDDYRPGNEYMDARERLQGCFDILNRYDVTKSSTSQEVYDRVWQIIRNHYEI